MKVELEEWELKALNYFLNEKLNDQGNAGCNDLPTSIEKLLSKALREKIARFSRGNEEINEEIHDIYVFDTEVLYYLKARINGKVK